MASRPGDGCARTREKGASCANAARGIHGGSGLLQQPVDAQLVAEDRCAAGPDHNGQMPILPMERDPRLIPVGRGGTSTDGAHRSVAEWPAVCAEHVLPLFEREAADDPRPTQAIAAV